MAQKPEDKLLNTTQNNDLSLTGKPVLVQNNIGIFYGFLEKSDTRSGTALLRDGFMLSPARHITFSQYLDFLSNEISDRYLEAENEYTKYFVGYDDAQPDGPPPDNEDIIPNEILINQDTFDEHHRDLSITDYASEGIYLVQRRTSSYENSNHIQSTAPLLSITNVIAIVAISERDIKHQGMAAIKNDIENKGFIEEVAPYYDSLTPMITFGLIDKGLQKLIAFTSLELDKSNTAESWTQACDIFGVTSTIKYMANQIIKRVETDINPDLIKEGIKPSKIIHNYLIEMTDMPSLVVNSNQRIDLYKKKAQENEQNT